MTGQEDKNTSWLSWKTSRPGYDGYKIRVLRPRLARYFAAPLAPTLLTTKYVNFMVIARLPVALTIAGSDSGGGAGIQADLKTFAALGVFGTSAITAVTAQNPDGVTAMQAIDPDVVVGQIRQVLDYFPVGSVKIGMLSSAEIIEAVAETLAELAPRSPSGEGRVPLVLDPVMVASSGAKLLNDDAMDALRKRMLPLASLITPNMDEAALLSGREVSTDEHLEPAARAIHGQFGVSVLVKGGHLKGSEEAIDVFYGGGETEFFAAPYLKQVNAHGTGCTLSSAIAVYLLRGFPVEDAISEGKNYLHQTLAGSLPASGNMVMNHAFSPLPLEMMG